MFSGEPTFVRFYRNGQRISRYANGLGRWLLIAPGLLLIFFGLAILVWPELLAYLVSVLLMTVGFSLAAWCWRMSRSARKASAQWRFVDGYERGPHSSVSDF